MKKILIGFLVLVGIGVCTALYMWNKPTKHPENAKEKIKISAADLFKAYSGDENKANQMYINVGDERSLIVNGEVTEVDKDTSGTLIVLETGDPIAKVACTMRDKDAKAEKGQKLNLVGFCTGSDITGVRLTDCVFDK